MELLTNTYYLYYKLVYGSPTEMTIRVAQKTTFVGLHSISWIFPLYWVSWSLTKKIRSLVQFFRSAQLTLIFWLFDVLLLYECCRNLHQNPCFWENCLYRAKNMFYPKTKVVPETLRNSWFHDKKFFTKKNYFGGIHGVTKMGKTPKITLFMNP